MKKTIIGIIIGVITTLTIGVYASNTFNSKDISYTNDVTEVNNVKDAVDELYDKTLSEINTLKEKYKGIDYLADVVSVGDYVAYDAGTWTESKEKPTSQGEFGGYTKDQNKANSVSWCFHSWYTTTLKGWRVFKIDASTKTVTLVHAGHPECYYHAKDASASITNINNRAASEYLNGTYADSAHNMTTEEALSITGDGYPTTNDLRYIGQKGTTGSNSLYWLAGVGNNADRLIYVYYDGILNDTLNCSHGIRPVVVLKSNILTTGKGTDMVGQEAWTLVKP